MQFHYAQLLALLLWQASVSSGAPVTSQNAYYDHYIRPHIQRSNTNSNGHLRNFRPAHSVADEIRVLFQLFKRLDEWGRRDYDRHQHNYQHHSTVHSPRYYPSNNYHRPSYAPTYAKRPQNGYNPNYFQLPPPNDPQTQSTSNFSVPYFYDEFPNVVINVNDILGQANCFGDTVSSEEEEVQKTVDPPEVSSDVGLGRSSEATSEEEQDPNTGSTPSISSNVDLEPPSNATSEEEQDSTTVDPPTIDIDVDLATPSEATSDEEQDPTAVDPLTVGSDIDLETPNDAHSVVEQDPTSIDTQLTGSDIDEDDLEDGVPTLMLDVKLDSNSMETTPTIIDNKTWPVDTTVGDLGRTNDETELIVDTEKPGLEDGDTSELIDLDNNDSKKPEAQEDNADGLEKAVDNDESPVGNVDTELSSDQVDTEVEDGVTENAEVDNVGLRSNGGENTTSVDAGTDTDADDDESPVDNVETELTSEDIEVDTEPTSGGIGVDTEVVSDTELVRTVSMDGEAGAGV